MKLPDGGRREIRAGSTLLATGGFQADRSCARRSIRTRPDSPPVEPYSTGGGLGLAQSVGARFRREDAGFYGHLFPSR